MAERALEVSLPRDAYWDDAFFEFDDAMADCFPPGEGARRSPIARRRREIIQKLELAWRTDPSSVARAELDALLDDLDVGFAKLEHAQRRPFCAFRAGLGLEAILPHGQAAR